MGLEPRLLHHPNATPERLAWIAREAPRKTNPGGWAASAIRNGWDAPAPSPVDEAKARRKALDDALSAFERMPPDEKAAILADVRRQHPNLAHTPAGDHRVRNAIARGMVDARTL